MIQFSIFDRSLIFARRHFCEISNVRQERGEWWIGKLKSGIHIRRISFSMARGKFVEPGREKNVIVKKEVRSYFWSRHPSHSCALCLTTTPLFFCSWIINSFSTTVLLSSFSCRNYSCRLFVASYL